MLQSLNTKRKTYELQDDVTAVEPENCTEWDMRLPSRDTLCQYESEPILQKLLFLPEHNFVCAATDHAVFLYDVPTKQMYTIRPYGGIMDAVHLLDGTILTLQRHASNRFCVYQPKKKMNKKASVQRNYKISKLPNVLSLLSFESVFFNDIQHVAKIFDVQYAFALAGGALHISSISPLNKGKLMLNTIKHIDKAHDSDITGIVRAGGFFLTFSRNDKTAKVWDCKFFDLCSILSHNHQVICAACNQNLIVTVCDNGDIFVRKNINGFPLNAVLRTGISYSERYTMIAVIILDDDILLLATTNTLSFVSISQKAYLSKIQVDYKIRCICVLGDGRIAVAGIKRMVKFFTPPENVSKFVSAYVKKEYPNYSKTIEQHNPLRAAWIAIRDGRLTFREACDNAISETNCTKSIDEWCFAHNILMEAVRTGAVPTSRNYKGKELHWLQVLYKHGSKLAMGNCDKLFVTSVFVEAEKAGVLAMGGADDFIHSVELRKDLAMENRMVINAIWHLFVKQAEMDERLREVLYYQRVQQLGAVINAVLGCVPVVGAIATNVLSGGLSVLNDFQVCGLVDSLMGISNDFGAFGTERLVDLFLCRSQEILSEKELEEVEPKKRKVLKDAAASLNLSIAELREQLRLAAKMHDKNHSKTPYAVVKEPDAKLALESSNLPIPMVVKDTNIELIQNGHVHKYETSEKSIDVEVLHKWKTKKLDNALVMELETVDIASLLSAYLVNFQESRVRLFRKLNTELGKQFEGELVIGRRFVGIMPKLTEFPLDVACTAITNVCETNRGLAARLIDFVHDVNS